MAGDHPVTESIDAQGRWILVESEDCRHCGAPSRPSHPAGVIAGRWTCYRCGRGQFEGASTSNPGLFINDAREARA